MILLQGGSCSAYVLYHGNITMSTTRYNRPRKRLLLLLHIQPVVDKYLTLVFVLLF